MNKTKGRHEAKPLWIKKKWLKAKWETKKQKQMQKISQESLILSKWITKLGVNE